MKKWSLLVMAVFVVAMSLAIVAPAGACEYGCTPGYWRQPHHFDSWPAPYSPTMQVREAFIYEGVHYGPKDTTLLEALKAKGGGENAFLRHAVAALLNAAAWDVNVHMVMWRVKAAYSKPAFERFKNEFEEWNELGCPLD